MNADERKALNKAIAVKLGWRVVVPEDDVVRILRLFDPTGKEVYMLRSTSSTDVALAWRRGAPDFCGSLDATASVLTGKPIRLSLDFEKTCAELEDMADEVDSEYGINRTYFGEPTSAADIAEAAARALDAWLTSTRSGARGAKP